MSYEISTPASPQPEDDVAELIGQVGRHWGALLAMGIVLIVLGGAIMFWPQATVSVLAILLGVSLIVSGIFGLVASFTTGSADTGTRVLQGIVGGLSILLGVLAFQSIFQAVEILALFIGIGWLMRGIFDIVIGLQSKGRPGRGWTIAFGVLGTLAGIVVLVWPGMTLAVLAWITGLWLVLFGVLQVIGSFAVRNAARREGLPV